MTTQELHFKKIQDWLKSIRGCSERDFQLLQRATQCLHDNFVEGREQNLSGCDIILPSHSTYLGVWNWDSAFIALSVSRWDFDLALQQIKVFFDFQDERGMFPDAVLLNGKVYDNTSKPPVFAWVLMEIDKRSSIPNIEYYYEKLVKNETFWCTYRKQGPLFHYDAFTQNKWYPQDCKNESGWDNSVRWDMGAENLWTVDLNCYMVTFYRAMHYFAKKLGLEQDCTKWLKKEQDLTDSIEEILWCEKLHCYSDFDYRRDLFTETLSPASFMPLFVQISSKERAEKCQSVAYSTEKFFPKMPTVAYDHKEYSSSDYWRGPSWLNVWYFVIVGLNNYGYEDLARKFKEEMLSICDAEQRGIFEYYDSRTGVGLGAQHFSWSAVFIIEAILNENLS